ncbi:hypothetical protein [Streptomyces sp. NPDC055036]
MQPELQTGQLWGGVAARIEAHTNADPGNSVAGSAPVFHLRRIDPALAPEPDDTLLTTFLTAVDGHTLATVKRTVSFERWARTSRAVAACVREDEAPELVVDRLMANLVVVNMAGALVDEQTCRVGLRSTFDGLGTRDGVLLTMRGDTADAPVELFPSLLYAWLSWWRGCDRALYDGPQIPPPPQRDTADIDDFAGRLAEWIMQAGEVKRAHPAPKVNVP